MAQKTTKQLYKQEISPAHVKLGKKIDALLEKKGWARNQFCIEAELSQYYFYRCIKGTCNISLTTIMKIAKVLKVKVRDLIEF